MSKCGRCVPVERLEYILREWDRIAKLHRQSGDAMVGNGLLLSASTQYASAEVIHRAYGDLKRAIKESKKGRAK